MGKDIFYQNENIRFDKFFIASVRALEHNLVLVSF